MEVRFADAWLERAEREELAGKKFPRATLSAFRALMRLIRSAHDERDFYALKSLHYEKLKGNRARERSMRLNKQYRLILTLEETSQRKTVVIVKIEDYHP